MKSTSAYVKKPEKFEESRQNVANFIKEYGLACGGNWAAMLMSAIKRGLPKVHEELDGDKEYTLDELFVIITENV
jgi:alpha-D-ribose 1-methylphosphonate 5-triphosphate synthase subunit PhnI